MDKADFPREAHWALLSMIRNPSEECSEEVWDAFRTGIIKPVVKKHYEEGWKRGLWLERNKDEAKNYFYSALIIPSLKWKTTRAEKGEKSSAVFLRIPYEDIKSGSMPFEEWLKIRQAGNPLGNGDESGLEIEYQELRERWEKWVKDHPLSKAWDYQEEGGSAREHLFLLAKQAMRDSLKPSSPKAQLKNKLKKVLKSSPQWFRVYDEEWYALSGNEAATWRRGSGLSGDEIATKFRIREGSCRHKGIPSYLPSAQEIREFLYWELFPEVQQRLDFKTLFDAVKTVFQVSSNGHQCETILAEDNLADSSPIPGDFDCPEDVFWVAATWLLLIQGEKSSRTEEGEIQTTLPDPDQKQTKGLARLLELSEPTLHHSFCPDNGKKSVIQYFLRVWIWLGEPTVDGKIFDQARYQEEKQVATSTFSDWRRKAEPVIKVAIQSIATSETHGGWSTVKKAIRLFKTTFFNVKPESVVVGYLVNDNDPPRDSLLPDEDGDEHDEDSTK